RLDDGEPLVGDRSLADRYDLLLQQEQARYVSARDEAELVMWLAGQCPECVPDGFGEQCDSHYARHDYAVARSCDV
ncbi:hypothetical protein, partial [Paractinoplanes ferrugineus]|uniref:hypothetical protein n=1 Tax=Paractinoplanes ferrugineus TaxID=113564 RepID=UPI0031D074EE